ncbi:MAG: hypothetical protein QXS63_00720 [Zestosphaera sp.]
MNVVVRGFRDLRRLMRRLGLDVGMSSVSLVGDLNTPLLCRRVVSELLAVAGDVLSQAGWEKNKLLRNGWLGG